MNPTSFKETNGIMGAGNNPNTEDLPVCHAYESMEIEGRMYDIPFVISKFKLSPEEIERINQKGELWVCIMGTGMPPILPTVQNPFEELNFKPQKT